MRLVVQANSALILILALGLHLAEVGLIGLAVIVTRAMGITGYLAVRYLL